MTMTTSIRLALALSAAVAPLSGCNGTPATAVVVNGYGSVWVYKVSWHATLFSDPVAPEGMSAARSTVPGSDLAYALIAPGWSPELGVPPAKLMVLQSVQRLSVAGGDQLEIRVFDDSFAGNCDAGGPLDADSARFIVERIFPGDFAGATYDAAGCTITPSGG